MDVGFETQQLMGLEKKAVEWRRNIVGDITDGTSLFISSFGSYATHNKSNESSSTHLQINQRSVVSLNESSEPSSNHLQVDHEYREVIAAQAVIGWDKFLMGLWSTQLIAKLKEEADGNIRIFRRPQRAIAAIISKLWDIGWQLWLGWNTAIYPYQELTAEGELVQRTQIGSSLCRQARRKRLDSQSRSREMMRRWIVRRDPST